MGTLLRSCAEVHEPIDLSFGTVSGVSPGIHVLNEGSRALKGRGCFADFLAFVPHWFEWAECRIFHTEMYSTRT